MDSPSANRGSYLAVILTLFALALPLPASATEDAGSGTPPQAALSVSAALNRCGLAKGEILCEIATSWNSIQHADVYTISVTRPDGSAISPGSTDALATSVWVPYVGPGNYRVSVAAWGMPPEQARSGKAPELIAQAASVSEGEQVRGTEREEPAQTPAETAPDDSAVREPECKGSVALADVLAPLVADTISSCPAPPLPPSQNPPERSSTEDPDDSSSGANG